MPGKNQIQLYKTVPHPCSYLDEREASNIVVDPELTLSPSVYGQLLGIGFRRSGCMVYRPACKTCNACQSSRVSVSQFTPSRSQRRAWKKANGHLSIQIKEAKYDPDQYQLYQRYTSARHADGDMKNSSPEQYLEFLTCHWSNTLFVELYYDRQLMAVAITDQQNDSLSALYTYFDPEMAKLSPGVLSILTQIELARQMELSWLYLGFWIAESPKMAYKAQYKPNQIFINDDWVSMNS